MKTAVNYLSSFIIAVILFIIIAVFILPAAKTAYDANPTMYHSHTMPNQH